MASRVLLILGFLLMSTTALAHGGGQYVIDEKQTAVRSPEGAAVSVNLTKKARFNDKGNPESSGQPTVRERVDMKATRENKILTATEIQHHSAVKNVPVITQ